VAQKLRQGTFALLDRHAPQVLAVQFEQVESAEHGGGVVPVPTDQVEDREPILVADDGLTVEQARAQGQRITAATICGKRFEKLVPFLVNSRTRPSARWARMRKPSCLIS
jgi:hypothetical protein